MKRTLTNAELGEITGLLIAKKRVARVFEDLGSLSIDRHLPFLVLHREPASIPGGGARLLATTEASYLVADDERSSAADLRRLARAVAEVSVREFGTFLILEIWSRRASQRAIAVGEDGHSRVGFRLFSSPQNQVADGVLTALHESLGKIKIGGRTAQVETAEDRRAFPERPLLTLGKGMSGVVHVGVEAEPCWIDQSTGHVFPAVLRSLRRQVSKALRRSLYHFIRQETAQRPRSFNVLGRRQVSRAVWEIDKKLDGITGGFDFLLSLNPTNTASLWREFKRSGFERPPVMRYRPLPLDVSMAKRKLFAIPIEKVEDPSLEHLFRQKQDELDRQLTMLKDRGTSRFVLGAYQLYGRIGPTLVRQAEEVLERVHGRRGGGRKGVLRFDEIRAMAQVEVDSYASKAEGPHPRIIPSPNLMAGLTVSNGDLLIDPTLKLSRRRARALLQHEVGTHMVTFLNGRAQPLSQLRSGLAAYEELQEGLAVLAEYLAGGLDGNRLRSLAARVLAAKFVLEGATFVDAFRYLCRYGFEAEQAFKIALRVYRGGGFIKDFIYLRGFDSVIRYLRDGKDPAKLYVGKIALKHVEIVDELRSRGVVLAPMILPGFLTSEESAKRLALLKADVPIYELASD